MTGPNPLGHNYMLAKSAVCLALLTLTSFVAVQPARAAAADSALLAAEMSASQEEYNADEAINVSFSLKNTSGKDLNLLLWGSPFEGMVTREFVHLQLNGNRLPYRGPVVKRAAPGIGDFQRLAAGESIIATWDLKQLFEFSSPGDYLIVLPVLTIQYLENGLQQLLSIHADSEVSFTIR